MKNTLNIKNITFALQEKGLNQADIARSLDITRSIVSLWFKNEKFPRPKKLLQLGRLLGLPFEALVIEASNKAQPQVAFRKKGKGLTHSAEIETALRMGIMLEELSSELPDNALFEKTVLRQPKDDYRYIQSYAAKIRQEINIPITTAIDYKDIIRKLIDLNVILIPVLWGEKESEDNALCVHLPRTETTWIYLNLDVKIHDFKFWIAHELAHVLISFDHSKEIESFMDKFAQALLFPEPLAKEAYKSLKQTPSPGNQLKKLFSIAEEHLINPYTVLKAINAYAADQNQPQIPTGSGFFNKWHQVNAKNKTVTEILLDSIKPEPRLYIQLCKDEFGSPFFDLLRNYLNHHEVSFGFVQNLLTIPLIDAKAIYQELL